MHASDCACFKCVRLIECHGKKMSVLEWSVCSGIPYATIKKRLRMGWAPERAVFQAIDILRRKGK